MCDLYTNDKYTQEISGTHEAQNTSHTYMYALPQDFSLYHINFNDHY